MNVDSLESPQSLNLFICLTADQTTDQTTNVVNQGYWPAASRTTNNAFEIATFIGAIKSASRFDGADEN